MKSPITRRDFLKLAGLLPLGMAALRKEWALYTQQNQQNIIVIVLDALSACNISLHGYQRETMPNLARLARRAVVYHNHYASGNYTTPGTASLLTGTMPWTHRAFQYRGTVDNSFIERNMFSAFQNYYRITYTHNPWADYILNQFKGDLEDYISVEKLLLTSDKFIQVLLANDVDTATVGWIRTIKKREEGFAYSLFLSHLYEKYRNNQIKDLHPQYPRGIPNNIADNYFLLEDAIDRLGNALSKTIQPFMGYFHFWPPHAPYNTHRDFYKRFRNDDWKPVRKPVHLFSKADERLKLVESRMAYDEFILYADREFGRFYHNLEISGLLKNTWIVLTSDHGELFERGIKGHSTPVLYEPLIRIPLMIFEPGRNTREDVYTPTNAIDVLPTLLHVTGQKQEDWIEGKILPPYGWTDPDSDRSIYVMEASKSEKYTPLTTATVALIKDQYKLMYFFGYEGLGTGNERVELYDLANDPEELNDLTSSKRETAAELLNELKQKLAEVNEPYL